MSINKTPNPTLQIVIERLNNWIQSRSEYADEFAEILYDLKQIADAQAERDKVFAECVAVLTDAEPFIGWGGRPDDIMDRVANALDRAMELER